MRKFYDNLLHDYFIKSVVDLTPGPGELAIAAMARGLGYVGLCMTEGHRDGLMKLFSEFVLEGMQSESSTFFQPRFDCERSRDRGFSPSYQTHGSDTSLIVTEYIYK